MNSPVDPISFDPQFQAFRRSFPAFEQGRYMSISSRGILSRETRDAIVTALDDQMYGRIDKAAWKAQAELARRRVAQLWRVESEEIALTKNVSDGLNMICHAIDWKPGDNMVCCLDYEHPNGAYAWHGLSKRGVALKNIPVLEGAPDIEAMIGAMDERTRLMAISAVNFSTGYRTPLAHLGQACRDRGVLFLVDGAQSAGVLDVSLREAQIDAYAVSSNKGLLGLYGLGYLFCDVRWACRLQPVYLSRFGIDAPGFADSDLGPSDYHLHAGAKRFDLGNANYPALIGSATSIGQLLDLGQNAIEHHALKLAANLQAGLTQLGYCVAHSGYPSHIVAVQPTIQEETRTQTLAEALSHSGIAFAIRRGMIRLGLHAYNDATDVQAALNAARLGIG